MRTILPVEIEKCRQGGPPNGGPHGSFMVRCPVIDRQLFIIVTDGRFLQEENDAANEYANLKGLSYNHFAADSDIFKWEHVSVSGPHFCPNWAEMCWVKDQFWPDYETVVQFHVPKCDHINIAKTCLHLWRLKPGTVHIADVTDRNLRLTEMPRPPSIAVGPKT